MLSSNLLDVVARMGQGELEAMAGAAENATSWGEMAQPSHAKMIKEAFLEPGPSAADMIMRGALEEEQIGPAVRILVRELWLHSKAGGKLPKGLEELKDYPLGMATVVLTGLFQAAATGNARKQALAGFTGGLLAFGQGSGGAMRRKARGLFGRNGRDEGMIQ